MNTNDTLTGRAEKYAAIEAEAGTAKAEPVATGMDIHVKVDGADMGSARCVTLSAANPWLPILPQDPNRSSAVLLAVDNDVYLCPSRDIAMEAAGSLTSEDAFYLPAGIAVPVNNRSAYWVACTTTNTSSRVSVLVSWDEPFSWDES